MRRALGAWPGGGELPREGRLLGVGFPQEAEGRCAPAPQGPSGSGLSCTRQGCPTVSGMTVHCHCPAAQGRRAVAVPTAQPGGGVSEGPGAAAPGCLWDAWGGKGAPAVWRE